MISIALIGWPILTIILSRLLPWPNAVVASLIGGYLLLPERGGLDLPLLPPLEKDTIPSLMLFFLALVMRPGQGSRPTRQPPADILVLKGWIPGSFTGRILLLLMVIGSFMTALTNSDPLVFSEAAFVIPGLRLYDGFSMVMVSTSVILPVLLGRKYLASSETHRMLLIGLVLAGLGYSMLALIEVRLSPQMSNWVYGFFPHSWQQHIRGNGFRPVVFLKHGLLLAIFFAMAILAALGMSRIMPETRSRWLLAGVWLMMTLVLCKSLSAIFILVLLLPVALWFNIRLQLVTAGLIAVLVLCYPFVRGVGLVPTEQIVSVVGSLNPERARSLQFRLNNEDTLLQRANERPLFGWGSFGRSRTFDDYGRDQTVVDGAWIAAIGEGGWLRYLSEFGLLSMPIILFALGRRRYNLDRATVALCLVLVANMIDMLPNAGQSPISWLIAGALFGRLERGQVTASATEQTTTQGIRKPGLILAHGSALPYTRQNERHHRTGFHKP